VSTDSSGSLSSVQIRAIRGSKPSEVESFAAETLRCSTNSLIGRHPETQTGKRGVAGVKRQHNILEQLGIDTQAVFGYKVLEPLISIRKTGVRTVGKAQGLPEEIYDRPPFPGPALAARVIGEITPEKVETVRKATKIVEDELSGTGAFQYLAILHEDRVTGIRDGKRDFGMQIEVRCWESKDAVVATPTHLSFDILQKLADRITAEVPGVVSVTYNITRKPTSTIEAI